MSELAPPVAVQQHYVQLLSPGSFFSETSSVQVPNWDPERGAAIAAERVRGRGGPFALSFYTRGRTATELDSRELRRSGTYYLGGQLFTLQELLAQNNPANNTLLANMRSNNWTTVVRTRCGNYQPFQAEDVLLDWRDSPKAGE